MTARGNTGEVMPLSEREAAMVSSSGTQVDTGAADEWTPTETQQLSAAEVAGHAEKKRSEEKPPGQVIDAAARFERQKSEAAEYGEGKERELKGEQRDQKLTELKGELQKIKDLVDVRLGKTENEERVVRTLRQERDNPKLPPDKFRQLTDAILVREKARDAARLKVGEAEARERELAGQITALEQSA